MGRTERLTEVLSLEEDLAASCVLQCLQPGAVLFMQTAVKIGGPHGLLDPNPRLKKVCVRVVCDCYQD